MGDDIMHDRPVGVIPSDVWEITRRSGEMCTDVWVRDMGGNAPHPSVDGESP